MGISASVLLNQALQVELGIAALYQAISAKEGITSEASSFFRSMAGQEHIHAAWVEEMIGGAKGDFVFEALEEIDFQRILTTLEDVHDEVLNADILLPDALEILVHLEESTAEEFYLKFPKGIPGLADSMVERMVTSCEAHAVAVAEFKKKCITRL